ncbi:hypothetical protein N9V57_05275 [SAR86 cluster bacterium]|nr:hypothetical protein [SAR86 cluster bacterium]
MHRDFIGIEIDKLFIPFIGKINNDIENNLIDEDIWKKASKKNKNEVEIKSNYISLKLTEMLLEEEKRLIKKLQRIRTEQCIELEKERARWRVLKNYGNSFIN